MKIKFPSDRFMFVGVLVAVVTLLGVASRNVYRIGAIDALIEERTQKREVQLKNIETRIAALEQKK